MASIVVIMTLCWAVTQCVMTYFNYNFQGGGGGETVARGSTCPRTTPHHPK